MIYGDMLFDGKPVGKGWLHLIREDGPDTRDTLAMQNGSYIFDELVPGVYHVEMSVWPNPRNAMRLVSSSMTITAENLVHHVPTVDVYNWGLVSPLDDEWASIPELNGSDHVTLVTAPVSNASVYHFYIRPADGGQDLWTADSPTNEVMFYGNLSDGRKISTGDYAWNVQVITKDGWALYPSLPDRGNANWGTSIEQGKRANHLRQGDRLIHFFDPSCMGNLSISTMPQGASIIIDGYLRKELSNTVVPFISLGYHSVVLFKGALRHRGTILIEKNNTTLLDCVLSDATTGMIIGKTTYHGVPVSMRMDTQKYDSTYGQRIQTTPDGNYLFDELPFGDYSLGSWFGAVDIQFSRKSLIHLDITTPIANLSVIDVYFSLSHPLEGEEISSTLTSPEHPLTFQWDSGMNSLNYSVQVISLYGHQTWNSEWASTNSVSFNGTFSDSSNLRHTSYRFTIYGTDDDSGGWWGQSTAYDLNVDGLNKLVNYNGSFNEIIAPEWYRQEIEKYDMIKVLDRGCLLEGQLAGTNPYRGKEQAYVYDYTQSFAAGSGNPIMMGKWFWRPDDPMFYGAFHEMGHGFQTGSCRSFDKLIAELGGTVSGSFAEAFASLSCYYITDAIQNEADHYGIGENATLKLLQHLQEGKPENYEALAKWQNETTPFSELTSVEVVCGMFYKLAEVHGWAWFRQFFKIFLPADEQWSLIDNADTFEKRITLLALCLSVAARTDLRDQFISWRVPIDDAFYLSSNATVYERMNRVETIAPTNLSVSLKEGKAVLAWSLSTSLYGIVGYNVYRNTSASQDPVKINRFIVADTEFADNETNSIEPPHEGSSYVYSITSVNNAIEPGESSRSDTVTLTIPNVSPNITKVLQTPPENDVLAEDGVRIDAAVTDDVSGVKNVTLVYAYANRSGTWIRVICMTNLEKDVWNATIPAFPYNTNVTYAIIAEDNVGNTITTEEMGFEYQYNVIPEFSSSVIMPLFMTATLTAVIVYERKRLARAGRFGCVHNRRARYP